MKMPVSGRAGGHGTADADLAAQHDVAIQEWVMFIRGDKTMLAACQSGLSVGALQALDRAERNPEGTGVRLLIKGPKDVPTVKKLAVVKLEN